MEVGGGLYFQQGFEATGEVLLPRAHVTGPLSLTGSFCNPEGIAFDGGGLQVDGEIKWHPTDVEGRIDFSDARASVWGSNKSTLGNRISLRGLHCDTLYPGLAEVPVKARLAWLQKDPNGYSPQPYAMLAAVYRAEGHDDASREVLVASARRRNRPHGWHGWPKWIFSLFLRLTVGYGYRPALAFGWLIIIEAIGSSWVHYLNSHHLFIRSNGAPPFSSVLYTLDQILPFVDVGYNRWIASGAATYTPMGLSVIGWLLSTAAIAALARTFRRGD